MSTEFEILGAIRNVHTIARGRGVDVRDKLNRKYGKGNWRKMKGDATVRVASGHVFDAEIHWYEAHGIGKKDLKIKKPL